MIWPLLWVSLLMVLLPAVLAPVWWHCWACWLFSWFHPLEFLRCARNDKATATKSQPLGGLVDTFQQLRVYTNHRGFFVLAAVAIGRLLRSGNERLGPAIRIYGTTSFRILSDSHSILLRYPSEIRQTRTLRD